MVNCSNLLLFNFEAHVEDHIRNNMSWTKIERNIHGEVDYIELFKKKDIDTIRDHLQKRSIQERIIYFISHLYKVDTGKYSLEYLIPFIPIVHEKLKIVCLHNKKWVEDDIGHLNDLLSEVLGDNYLNYTIQTGTQQAIEFKRGDISSKFLLLDKDAANFKHDSSLRNYIKNVDMVIDFDLFNLPTYNRESFSLSFIKYYLNYQQTLRFEQIVKENIDRNQFYNEETYQSFVSLTCGFLKILFQDLDDVCPSDIHYIFDNLIGLKANTFNYKDLVEMDENNYKIKSYIEKENLPMGKIDISQGEYFSIKDQLSVYFQESSSITIKHRYIYYPYIFKNILEFIYGIHFLKEGSTFSVYLITDKDPKYPERQISMLEDMKLALENEGIDFGYQIYSQEDTAHFRTVSSNDGIELSLDKGFDLFNKPLNQFSKESIYPDFRTTSDTYFIVKTQRTLEN